jgi:hypothetical protein
MLLFFLPVFPAPADIERIGRLVPTEPDPEMQRYKIVEKSGFNNGGI